MKLDPLLDLPTASLRSLAGSLREGALSAGVSNYAVRQIAGPRAQELEECLRDLHATGVSLAGIAVFADAVVQMRARTGDPALLFDLVLSGPDVPGISTADTAATMRSLVEQANSEILLVGYAVHNAEPLFAPVAARMAANSALKVIFYLDIGRKVTDSSLDNEIVRRFAIDFRAKHWPWPTMPQIYYDPRSLALGVERSSLHAKCVVVDRSAALITSANFTDAAQQRNIEAGVLVRYVPLARRLAEYFEGLRAVGQLVPCTLAS